MEDEYDFGSVQTEEEPVSEPSQPFQVKDYGGRVDWNKVNQAVGTYLRVRDFQARQEAARQRAERDAIQYQGMVEYQSLIDGGATPQEALRRTGSKIWYKNPASFGSAVRQMNPAPVPRIIDVDGHKVFDFGNRFQVVNDPGKSDEEKMDEFTRKSEYQSAQKAFESAKKGVKQSDGKFKVDDAALADATRRYRIAGEQLRAPSTNKVPPSVSSPAPNKPQKTEQGFSEGQLIRSKKDGKLYRVKNGKPELVEE